MTDHDALLRAICENPQEDTPRLAFADWLDENADALADPAAVRSRAQFVRDDIAMSQLGEHDPLRLRWELIEKPRREADGWGRGLPLTDHLLNGPLLRRGFVWGVRMNPRQFLTEAERLYAFAPLTTLAFASDDGAADALFQSTHFARLTGLRIHRTNLPERMVTRLAKSPHVALEELNASDGGLAPTGVSGLLRSPLFPRLTRLDLSASPVAGAGLFGARGLSAISGSVRLRDLALADTGLTHDHVPHLLTANAVAGVERLRLGGNRFGTAGHQAIARLPLDHLRDLDLSDTAPGPAGTRLLSTSLTLSRLRRLGYRRNGVTPELLTELAGCYEVSNLRVLDLASNVIGDAGATAIARSPHFAGLLVLNLDSCAVGDAGILSLIDSPLADGLVLLNLANSSASAETKELLKARMGDRVRV